MLSDKPPYFYKCNSCGKEFISDIKPNPIYQLFDIKILFNIRVECYHCGSRDVKVSKLNDFIEK